MIAQRNYILIVSLACFLLLHFCARADTTSISKRYSEPRKISFDACNDINWATWSDFLGMSAVGTIVNGAETVNVTMTSNFTFGSTPEIYTHSKFSTYPAIIPNTTVPQTTWSKGPGGTTTMCFSKTVTNPVLLIASLGSSSGIQAKLNFSKPYVVLFDGGNMQYHNSTSLTGTEGYAIIMFPGDFDCVTINSTTQEFYTNITWGTKPPPFAVNINETKNCGSNVLTASGGVAYLWNGGDTPTSATNTFHTSGTYIVTVTDANGCKSSVSKEVMVSPTLSATVTGNLNGCSSVVLTASGGISYLWDGGSNPTNATNTFTTSGTYTVIVTGTDGCTAPLTQTVSVGPPIVSISGAATNCDEVTLVASGGVIYQWDGGVNPTSATNTFTTSGKYTVLVTDDKGCTSSAEKTVIIQKVTAGITGSTVECQRVILTASGGVSYEWDGGSDPTSATNIFDKSGKYTVIVTDANGCKATASSTITVINATLGLNLSSNTCGPITVTASGGVSYQWDGGNSPNSAVNTFAISGKYNVTSINSNGCPITASVDLVVNTIFEPKISITSAPTGTPCAGTPITFSAIAENGGTMPVYTWFKNGVSVGSTPVYTMLDLKNNDEITCELTSNLNCATPKIVLSNTINVTMNDRPSVSFASSSIVTSTPISLHPIISSDVTSYEWSPSDGLSDPTIKNPTAFPKTPITYQLKVTNTLGCEAIAAINVTVLRDIIIPNSFSPNGDGVNDQWEIKNLAGYPGSKISVYNRYGTIIFQSYATSATWDGKYHGKNLSLGTYYYVIVLKDKKSSIYKGSITILN